MIIDKRNDERFQEIKDLNDVCFTGIERPPEAALRYNYDNGTLFTWRVLGLAAFAIVTQEGGQPYLWTLATHPALRRHGFGSTLLKEIIEWARCENSQRIDLTVNVNNSAQKLYFDHGFRVVKVIPRFYGESNGLRMRRLIP